MNKFQTSRQPTVLFISILILGFWGIIGLVGCATSKKSTKRYSDPTLAESPDEINQAPDRILLAGQWMQPPPIAKDDPRWPLATFLMAEKLLQQRDIVNARRLYRGLAQWAADDPYGDTWGGCGLAIIALWRWARLLNPENGAFPHTQQPDKAEVRDLLEAAERLRQTRFMQSTLHLPDQIISAFPRLEADLMRQMATLAYMAGMTAKARQVFLEYLGMAYDDALSDTEKKLFNLLIADKGSASLERIDLMRAKRLFVLKKYGQARKLLQSVLKSENLQLRAQAGFYLARLKRYRGAGCKTITPLIEQVLEDAVSPDLIQNALFERALVCKRPGRQQNIEQFKTDLFQIMDAFPQGRLADDALYQLAKYHETQGELEVALDYYKRLRHFQGRNNWVHSAFFKPAMALVARGKMTDLENAQRLLTDLEKDHPLGPFHLAALFWRARIAEQTGNGAEAERLFKAARTKAPYGYYGLRARMHLRDGPRAISKPQTKALIKELKPLIRSQNPTHKAMLKAAASPYHARLKEALQSGLYATVFRTEGRLRISFPSTRQEDLPLNTLARKGFLASLSVLLALRLDALAAKDATPDVGNPMKIARAVAQQGQDRILAMNLVMLFNRSFKVKPALLPYPDDFKTMYPPVYRKQILKAGRLHHIPPELLYSVIRMESFFDASALSPRGALGLMQFTPRTFRVLNKRWRLLERGGVDSRTAFLINPDLAIELGARWFRQELLNRYHRKGFDNQAIILALMDHNAGYPAVRQWVRQWQKQGRLDDIEYVIETIPFLETRRFVQRIWTGMVMVKAMGMFR